MVAGQDLSTGSSNTWIVDSGATSHMCNKKEFFVEYDAFQQLGEVTIGDGHVLEVVGCGTVN